MNDSDTGFDVKEERCSVASEGSIHLEPVDGDIFAAGYFDDESENGHQAHSCGRNCLAYAEVVQLMKENELEKRELLRVQHEKEIKETALITLKLFKAQQQVFADSNLLLSFPANIQQRHSIWFSSLCQGSTTFEDRAKYPPAGRSKEVFVNDYQSVMLYHVIVMFLVCQCVCYYFVASELFSPFSTRESFIYFPFPFPFFLFIFKQNKFNK